MTIPVVQQRISFFRTPVIFDISPSRWILLCSLQISVTMSLEKWSEKWHLFFSDVSSTSVFKALKHWDNKTLYQGDSKQTVAFKQICLNFLYSWHIKMPSKKICKFRSVVILKKKLMGLGFLGFFIFGFFFFFNRTAWGVFLGFLFFLYFFLFNAK